MLLLLGLVLPLLGVGALHVAAPRRWSRWIVAGLGVLALAIGGFGTLNGRALTDAALASLTGESATASDISAMRQEGYAEAILPIELGGALAGAAGLTLAIGFLRRRSVAVAPT